LASLVLVAYQGSQLEQPDHDTTISVIAATGHLTDYAEDAPPHRWTPASAWQRFWTPEDAVSWEKLSADLGARDIHPPLYFFVLSHYIDAAGVSLFGFALLNGFLVLLTAPVVYLSARQLGYDAWPSAFAGGLYVLSGSVVQATVQARQYCLAGLLVALFAWALIAFHNTPNLPRGIALSIATAASALTHYGTIPIMAGGYAAFLVTSICYAPRHRFSTSLRAILSGALSVLAFLYTHPNFANSFRNQQSQRQPFALETLLPRVRSVVGSLLELVFPVTETLQQTIPAYNLVLVGIAGVLCLAFILLAAKNPKALHPPGPIGPRRFAALFVLLSLFAYFALYLAHLLPEHALAVRYSLLFAPPVFAVLAPFVSSVIAKVAGHRTLVALVVGGLLIQGSLAASRAWIFTHYEKLPALTDAWAADVILVDTRRRGILPRILWKASPDADVYAATQTRILRSPPSFDIPTDRLVYAHTPLYDQNDQEKREAIHHHLGRAGYRLYQESDASSCDDLELRLYHR
jgi:hypothetical protein